MNEERVQMNKTPDTGTGQSPKIEAEKPTEVIGKKEIQKATATLQNYKKGKASLESRIIENEQWWKLRHWDYIRKNEKGTIEPASGWLFNSVANKHADAMDNFPAPNILPREQGDEQEAKTLTSIIPVILEENDFERTYSKTWWSKLKAGTGVYGAFWNSKKLNGLGDVEIKRVDLLNLFYKPGITDFQDSKNVFYIRLVDNDTLEAVYPQLRGKLSTPSITVSEYAYDDAVDTSNKSVVVDWYYKKNTGEKTVLHFVKFVNDEVLFATENDKEFRENGLYDHGKYPFIFDPLYTVEGSPAGFGVIDIGKSAQKYIDKMNSAILTNALVNAQPRVFARTDGGLNEKEYLNPEKPIVHVNSMSEDVIRAVDTKPLSDIYVSVFDRKIEEIKETTGNRDVANGGTTSGVTAASAIAAMQEASGKLSRDMLKQSYTAYKELVFMIIELVRQFYSTPRCFRIIGENGAYSFESFSNQGIVPQMQGGNEFGVETGYRVPEFDIEVTAQKASPYSKMAQNELALQFYNLGFFLPQNADQSLACLEMMDFDRKEKIIQKVQQNGTLLQMVQSMQAQIQKLSEIINVQTGGALGEPDSIDGLLEGQTTPKADAVETAIETDQLGGAKAKESGVTENARKQTAESTTP